MQLRRQLVSGSRRWTLQHRSCGHLMKIHPQFDVISMKKLLAIAGVLSLQPNWPERLHRAFLLGSSRAS